MSPNYCLLMVQIAALCRDVKTIPSGDGVMSQWKIQMGRLGAGRQARREGKPKRSLPCPGDGEKRKKINDTLISERLLAPVRGWRDGESHLAFSAPFPCRLFIWR